MQAENRRSRAFGTFIAAAILFVAVVCSPMGHASGGVELHANGKATAPHGWRRTKNGWEHTSTWTLSNLTINQLIAAQRDREPAWIRFGFAKLRSIPPLMIAVLQITAIAVITNVAQNHRRRAQSDAAE